MDDCAIVLPEDTLAKMKTTALSAIIHSAQVVQSDAVVSEVHIPDIQVLRRGSFRFYWFRWDSYDDLVCMSHFDFRAFGVG